MTSSISLLVASRSSGLSSATRRWVETSTTFLGIHGDDKCQLFGSTLCVTLQALDGWCRDVVHTSNTPYLGCLVWIALCSVLCYSVLRTPYSVQVEKLYHRGIIYTLRHALCILYYMALEACISRYGVVGMLPCLKE
ncbi:hypothetical protein V8C37DRAFT_373560 [Trichoderma ceciliae]